MSSMPRNPASGGPYSVPMFDRALLVADQFIKWDGTKWVQGAVTSGVDSKVEGFRYYRPSTTSIKFSPGRCYDLNTGNLIDSTSTATINRGSVGSGGMLYRPLTGTWSQSTSTIVSGSSASLFSDLPMGQLDGLFSGASGNTYITGYGLQKNQIGINDMVGAQTLAGRWKFYTVSTVDLFAGRINLMQPLDSNFLNTTLYHIDSSAVSFGAFRDTYRVLRLNDTEMEFTSAPSISSETGYWGGWLTNNFVYFWAANTSSLGTSVFASTERFNLAHDSTTINDKRLVGAAFLLATNDFENISFRGDLALSYTHDVVSLLNTTSPYKVRLDNYVPPIANSIIVYARLDKTNDGGVTGCYVTSNSNMSSPVFYGGWNSTSSTVIQMLEVEVPNFGQSIDTWQTSSAATTNISMKGWRWNR